MVTSKPCKPGHVRNPLTNRCISVNGKLYRHPSVFYRLQGKPVPENRKFCSVSGRKVACIGTKKQVYQGFAMRTSGGLKRADLEKNPRGRIVSRRRRAAGLAQEARTQRLRRASATPTPKRGRSRSRSPGPRRSKRQRR